MLMNQNNRPYKTPTEIPYQETPCFQGLQKSKITAQKTPEL